jgi:signal transduction histidine kinase
MSIKTRLVAVFLAFTIIPMTFLGALVFYKTRIVLQAVRLSQLENIADLKKDKIETFFRERAAGITAAQHFLNIKRNLPLLIRGSNGKTISSSYTKAVEELDGQMQPFQEAYGYIDVMLTDPEGRTVYVSNSSHKSAEAGKSRLDRRAYEEGKKGIYFTDVIVNRDLGNRFEMFAVAPLRDLGGRFIGEAVIEIDMGPIYKFIQDATGLGKTGEALIVRREGDTVLFMSPLRHDPDAALKKKVLFNEKSGFPAQRSAEGKNGSGLAADYSGVDVLAAWRYLPSLRWGLVTKIDAREAFESIARIRNLFFLIGICIAVLAVVAALRVAKSFSGPITALQKGAEIIGSGDLSYRVGTDARDEIGQLSRAFDRMTGALARTDAELRQKAAELEASNKELESFSYSVSHDLRAPLRHISGFMELLRQNAWPVIDETGRRYMTTILESSKRMGMLIDDLLAFSRIGRSEMKVKTVDTEKLVKDVIREMQGEIKGRDIVWKIEELPHVYGDPSMLRLVLVNLISNAVKFTRTRPQAEIDIGCSSGEGECVFSVKDNGVGFDMKYAEKLFGVFQRLHRQEEFEGTGIGLANVRRIVARHGGRTWAEGSVDGGATIYFALPTNKEM